MTKTFALIYGIVFIIVGVAGFIPGLVQPVGDHGLVVDEGHGLLFGLFPVNILHNIVHLLFGIWGLLAARTLGAARGYFKAVFIIYAVLAVLGLIPAANTLFGLVPLHGNDVWLHVLLALPALYFGFIRRERVAEVRV